MGYYPTHKLPCDRIKDDLKHGRITESEVRAKSAQYAAEFCNLMGDPPFFDIDTDWRGRNAEWREIMCDIRCSRQPPIHRRAAGIVERQGQVSAAEWARTEEAKVDGFG